MSNEVIKVQIANRLLDEYGKDIQSQCLGGCVSRGDANKTIFAIRQSARKLKAMTRDEFAKLGGKKSTRKCSSGAASGTNGKTAITTRMPFTERMRARWTSCLPKQSS